MTIQFITLEIDDDGRGLLEFELPLDVTDAQIAYIKSLVPRVEAGLLELLDPETREIVFRCTPRALH
jgi:hypothetical protein